MSSLGKVYSYSRMDIEDPEEQNHRHAQFLIGKVLKRADHPRKPWFMRLRLCRLKIKMGKRLKRLRKRIQSIAVSSVEKFRKFVFQRREATAALILC